MAFTVEQNTGYVEQAKGGMAEGALADIERRAKAQVIVAEGESKKLAVAEEDAAKVKSPSAEGQVYGDLAAHAIAPGIQLLKNIGDFVGAREADKKTGLESADARAVVGENTKARHIEDDIRSANRAPGSYRMPLESKIYDDVIAKGDIDFSKGKKSGGEDILMRANITEKSLKEQDKDALESWDVKEAKIVGVKQARELTFGARMSNEHALESVQKAREMNMGMTRQAVQMAPHLSMMSGPTIRPEQLLSEAREESGNQ